MRNSRIILYLTTAVFLIGSMFLFVRQVGKGFKPFFVEVSTFERIESIDLWESESGDYYVFLPTYVDPHQVFIRIETTSVISINDVILKDGMNCELFSPDVQYELAYQAWGRLVHKNITFVYSENISTLFIDTESGAMDFIHEEKGNSETGHMRLYTADGLVNADMEVISVYGRGNQTWSDYEKKPYGFVLNDEADLLGLGEAQKWVLFANAADASHMRNKAVYTFAEQIGLEFSPDCEWVDLYLNGEYAGLYLLCERNEVHPERVNLLDVENCLVSMQIEGRLIKQNYPYVVTKAKQALRIHNPNNPSVDTIGDIVQIFQSVENALLDEHGLDHTTGKSWEDLIDLDSWVKIFLIDEIFGNVDACYSSLYFYVNVSDGINKVFAGPVWDYDHSMGSGHIWHIANPNTMYANRLHVKPETETPWFNRLYQKTVFYNRMVDLYKNLFLPELENFMCSLDCFYEEIKCSARMNSIRWSMDERDLFDEVEYIKSFLSNHITFLSDIWLNESEYEKVTLSYGDWSFYGYFYVRTGKTLTYVPQLPDKEYSTFQGWYYRDSGEIFDITKPITEDIEIYSRWGNKPLKWVGQIIKLIPLLIISMIGVALAMFELRRWSSYKGDVNDRTEISP